VAWDLHDPSPGSAIAGRQTVKDASEIARTSVRRVLLVTLLLNLAVSGGKIVVGMISGSLSMLADGYHSLLDGSNNVIGLVVTAFAFAPPDRGHPYGHRKFESAATLAIGAGLLALAYRIISSAITHASRGQTPRIGALNWLVMGATLAVNLFVAWYEAGEGRRLGSQYLVADAAHTRSDVYVSLGVVASFWGAHAGLPWLDSLVAAVIAAFITYLALGILARSFHVLTDRAVLPPEAIAVVVLGVPGVRACRDIRTRGGPGAVYVDLVAHVDGNLSLRDAHAVADGIEAALTAAHFEIVDVVVHLEPSRDAAHA
jgi:cation diffusion facilitator family transporter